MKSKFFLIKAAILLLVAGNLVSCTNRVETEVDYFPCFCSDENNESEELEHIKGTAYLFKGCVRLIPYDGTNRDKRLSIITFDPEEKIACIYYNDPIGIGAGGAINRICNFPDFAKEWNIPETGIIVNYEGYRYKACKYEPYIQACGCVSPSSLGVIFYIDFILTNLIKK